MMGYYGAGGRPLTGQAGKPRGIRARRRPAILACVGPDGHSVFLSGGAPAQRQGTTGGAPREMSRLRCRGANSAIIRQSVGPDGPPRRGPIGHIESRRFGPHHFGPRHSAICATTRCASRRRSKGPHPAEPSDSNPVSSRDRSDHRGRRPDLVRAARRWHAIWPGWPRGFSPLGQ